MQNHRDLTIGLASAGSVSARIYEATGPSRSTALILAHGAGAGQTSPFMVASAQAFAARGFDTITFNFLYIEQRRRAPDRRPALEACYRSVIEQVRTAVPAATRALFIGGKSMGGRIATHVATDPQLALAGVVLLGYPLHPPGRPLDRRDAHLADVAAPMLFVQGSRDAFGTPEELEPALSAIGEGATMHVVEGGDHSFKVPRSGAQGQAAVHASIEQAIDEWMMAIRPAPAR